MQNLCQWAIWSVLLWSTLTHASWPTFEWKDPNTHEKLLCEKCSLGMSMAKPCTWDTHTQCKPCANEHYTQYCNYVERCLYCSVHCNVLEVEVGPCNRVCKCKLGYHAESLFCIEHSKCLTGSRVVVPVWSTCWTATPSKYPDVGEDPLELLSTKSFWNKIGSYQNERQGKKDGSSLQHCILVLCIVLFLSKVAVLFSISSFFLIKRHGCKRAKDHSGASQEVRQSGTSS